MTRYVNEAGLQGRFRRDRRTRRELATAVLLAICVIGFACKATSTATNTNSIGATASEKRNENSASSTQSENSGSQPSGPDIKEPDRYTVAMTISSQDMSSGAPAPMATHQFGFAKLDSDRRWALPLPAPLGQVVYLEKSGLKYLVLLDRKQYAEVPLDALPFEMARMLTAVAAVERLKQRMSAEKQGIEPINGRTAVKYRLRGDGGGQSDGLLYVDQEIGLPLRLELSMSDPSGGRTRVVVEARDIQLSVDRAQFEVPAGTKKLTQQEAKPQIEAFATALRSLAEVVSGAKSSTSSTGAAPADKAAPKQKKK